MFAVQAQRLENATRMQSNHTGHKAIIANSET